MPPAVEDAPSAHANAVARGSPARESDAPNANVVPPGTGGDARAFIEALVRGAAYGPAVLLLAAHPDDECVGLGGHLELLRSCWIVHLTDGAPRDRSLWPDATRRLDRASYERLRRAELARALALAGVPAERCLEIGLVDHEALDGLATATLRFVDVLSRVRPAVVVTHAYDGGHPDHDACAFVAQAAIARSGVGVARVDMATYHGASGALEACTFATGDPGTELPLAPEQREARRRQLACFTSQSATLAPFVSLDCGGRLRASPVYDFTAPPHAGALHYERFPGRVSGARFRALAQEAQGALAALAPGRSAP
jgi:LmbE family N-acetylglucosaminyl deacetylase